VRSRHLAPLAQAEHACLGGGMNRSQFGDDLRWRAIGDCVTQVEGRPFGVPKSLAVGGVIGHGVLPWDQHQISGVITVLYRDPAHSNPIAPRPEHEIRRRPL